VEWESQARGKSKAGPSLKSCLSTLKNPHNFLARAFAPKTEKKGQVIICNRSLGTQFGNIDVSDNYNANTDSSTSDFGDPDANESRASAGESYSVVEKWQRRKQAAFSPAPHPDGIENRNSESQTNRSSFDWR
jgi:hypothetical protein